MKFALILSCLVSAFANAAELKSCAEHMPDVKVCIDLMSLLDFPDCTNIVYSGETWVDEVQLDAISEMFTATKEYCELLTSSVPYGSDNEALKFCCGG